MKQRGKVQTNEFGTNVLVEHEKAIGKHYHHSDKLVLSEKMTQEEIDKAYAKLTPKTAISVFMTLYRNCCFLIARPYVIIYSVLFQ